MGLNASGLRGHRATGGSYFKHSGWEKPFWGDASWAESWEKRKSRMFPNELTAHAKACRSTLAGVGVSSSRGLSWVNTRKRGGKRITDEAMNQSVKVFRFKCGQWHDLIGVIKEGPLEDWWTMDKSKSYKTEVSEMLVATYHRPGFGNLRRSNPLALGYLPQEWWVARGAVGPGEEQSGHTAVNRSIAVR